MFSCLINHCQHICAVAHGGGSNQILVGTKITKGTIILMEHVHVMPSEVALFTFRIDKEFYNEVTKSHTWKPSFMNPDISPEDKSQIEKQFQDNFVQVRDDHVCYGEHLRMYRTSISKDNYNCRMGVFRVNVGEQTIPVALIYTIRDIAVDEILSIENIESEDGRAHLPTEIYEQCAWYMRDYLKSATMFRVFQFQAPHRRSCVVNTDVVCASERVYAITRKHMPNATPRERVTTLIDIIIRDVGQLAKTLTISQVLLSHYTGRMRSIKSRYGASQ